MRVIRWMITILIAESHRVYAVAGFEAREDEKGNGRCERGSWRRL